MGILQGTPQRFMRPSPLGSPWHKSQPSMAGLQMLPLLHTIVTSDKITYPPLPLPQKYPKTISTSKPVSLAVRHRERLALVNRISAHGETCTEARPSNSEEGCARFGLWFVAETTCGSCRQSKRRSRPSACCCRMPRTKIPTFNASMQNILDPNPQIRKRPQSQRFKNALPPEHKMDSTPPLRNPGNSTPKKKTLHLEHSNCLT